MAGTQNIKTVKLDVAGFPEEITVLVKPLNQQDQRIRFSALKGERLAYGKVGPVSGNIENNYKSAEDRQNG